MEDIDNLIATLAEDVRQVEPAAHPFFLSLKWIGAAAIYLVAALAVSGLRADFSDKLQSPMFVAEIAALFGIFASTSFAAALLAFPDMHQKKKLVFAPLVAFALFLLTLFFAWHQDMPAAPLPVHSFECTLSIMLMALLPSIWIFYSMRNYASTHSALAGGNALLASFSIGALWLRLHEVNDSILHVIAWHYLPMLSIGLVGLWLGKKILKW